MATLTADIARDQTSLPISGSLGLRPPFNVQIDKELCRVEAASSDWLSVRRGIDGTGQTVHLSGATVYLATPAVQTGPPASPPSADLSTAAAASATAAAISATAAATSATAAAASATAAASPLKVVHAPPVGFDHPLMLDDTPSTGGLYAWTGSAYVKVALALT